MITAAIFNRDFSHHFFCVGLCSTRFYMQGDVAHTGDMAAHGWPAHRARQVAGRPRGHVGARVGRHVWLAIERERKSLRGEFVPLFNRAVFLYFLRVGLCSHTVFLFCRTRGGARSVRFQLNGGDRVDPSPRDHDQSTCVKTTLSGCDRSVYPTPRGDARSVG